MGEYELLSKRFNLFKEITEEEEKIVNLIKENVYVGPVTTVLDIGSNKGSISKSIQKDVSNITLVDVEDFDVSSEVKFVRGKWEELKLDTQFDLVIASHVWGHFHHDKTTTIAFVKALKSVKPKGKLVLCYNSNNGVVGELVSLGKNLFKDFQYDIFDEGLVSHLNKMEIPFSVSLRAKSFEELVNLIQVLLIVTDEEFELKKKHIENYLRSRLSVPEFEVWQKIVIVSL